MKPDGILCYMFLSSFLDLGPCTTFNSIPIILNFE